MIDKKGETIESELEKPIGTAVPILAPGIGTRIKAAADAIRSRKYAAQAAGVSTDMLYRYFREESSPSFGVVAGLACASKFRLEWLATGEGPQQASGTVIREPEAAYKVIPDSFNKRMERLQWAVNLTRRAIDPLGLDLSDRLYAVLLGLLFEGLLEPAALDILAPQIGATIEAARLRSSESSKPNDAPQNKI